MDNTTNNFTQDDHHIETALYAEHIWMIFTSILNIIANVLIIVTMYQIRSKSSVYRFISLLSATDIFSRFFAPTTFEILGTIHDIFDYELVHQYLSSLYITGMICGVLVLIAMVLRNHFSFVEKYHIFIIFAICITGVVYFSVACSLVPYRTSQYLNFSLVLLCLLLLLTTYTEQMIHLVHLDKAILSENQLSSAMVMIFVGIRMLFALAILLANIIPSGRSSTVGIILLSFVDFNSIVNIVLLVHNDVNFKMRLCEMLRLNSLIRNNPVRFINNPDDNLNIVVDD